MGLAQGATITQKKTSRRPQYCDAEICVKLTRSTPNATSLVALKPAVSKSWLAQSQMQPARLQNSCNPCWLHLGLKESTFETTGFIWVWFLATLLVAFGIERVNFETIWNHWFHLSLVSCNLAGCIWDWTSQLWLVFLALLPYLCYILVPGLFVSNKIRYLLKLWKEWNSSF